LKRSEGWPELSFDTELAGVNPEGAKMQIEGGITMGLGYTLAEEVRFDDRSADASVADGSRSRPSSDSTRK